MGPFDVYEIPSSFSDSSIEYGKYFPVSSDSEDEKDSKDSDKNKEEVKNEQIQRKSETDIAYLKAATHKEVDLHPDCETGTGNESSDEFVEQTNVVN